jgi:uncharacterized peroxidase-related enzyme
VTLDEDLVRALEQDYTQAPITKAERAMLDYVVQLTKDATRIGPQDHERLRAEGFDDRGILQMTLIASWFNYINRVADALGVGRESLHRTTAQNP